MKWLAAYFIVCIPVTFGLYLAVMWLQRWRDVTPRKPALLIIAKGFLFACVAWDFIVNVFPVTLLFLDPHIEGSISQRLRRLVKSPDGWRKTFAVRVAMLLNRYSNYGPHIPL